MSPRIGVRPTARRVMPMQDAPRASHARARTMRVQRARTIAIFNIACVCVALFCFGARTVEAFYGWTSFDADAKGGGAALGNNRGAAGKIDERVTKGGIGDIARDGTTIGSRGGTELLSEALKQRLPRALAKRFHIIKSRVRHVSKDPNVLNILWLNDLPMDPESAHLSEASSRDRFAAFVFVSEWQKLAYKQRFGDVFQRSVILRNAIEPFPQQTKVKSEDGIIRLIYHTTPHRGLEILLPVFEELYKRHKKKITLDVYSSFSIYGWNARDEQYKHLFDSCREHPGCNYHGAVPNEEIREALVKSHIFAYPSIFPETSCISAIEALSAGVEVVTSSLGALPETLSTFGHLYEFNEDKEAHADLFKDALDRAIKEYWTPFSEKRRRTQQVFASQVYDWGTAGFQGRIDEWIRFLGSIHKAFSGENPIVKRTFKKQSDYIDALNVAGRIMEVKQDITSAMKLYEKVLEIDSMNQFALLATGNSKMMNGDALKDTSMMLDGVERLEYVLEHADELNPPLPRNSNAYYGVAVRSGFYRIERQQGEIGYASFDRAEQSGFSTDDCWLIYRATSVVHVPSSEAVEREVVNRFSTKIDSLLQKNDMYCANGGAIANAFGMAYYDADYKEQYERWVNLRLKVTPTLKYQAKQLMPVEDNAQSRKKYSKQLKSRKIRVGFVSSFFSTQSSIWGNFGWTLQELQKDKRLEVDFIYYPRTDISVGDKRLSMNPDTNVYLEPLSVSNENLATNREIIEKKKYDVLIYLDLYMTGEMHKLALSKLAPVQITTHGHPVTSGIARDIMDYYLSWDMAELPDAQKWYTEELLFINSKKSAWELYMPRTDENERSLVGGGYSFADFTRENLDFIPEGATQKLSNPKATWYFCAQASFKYHVTFDRILGDIQKQDPNAVLILIELTDPELKHMHPRISARLEKEGGVDLSRVAFIPRMAHYRLMAMYKLADVVLDSVYFGGDTTTREAFEVGAPIVTLPGKALGQRWTQAYYKVMGITKLIAKDANDYVRVAIATANASDAEKQALRASIKNAVFKKLYRNTKAAKLWADAILSVAYTPKRVQWRSPGDEKYEATRHDEL